MFKRFILACALVCALSAPAHAVTDIVLLAGNALPAPSNPCTRFSGNVLALGPWIFQQCSAINGSHDVYWIVPLPNSFTGTFSQIRVTYLPAGFDPTAQICFRFRLTVFNFEQGTDGNGAAMLTAPQTSQVIAWNHSQSGVVAAYQSQLSIGSNYTPGVRTGVTNAETLCSVGSGAACRDRIGLAVLERDNTGACASNLSADILIDNVRLRN